MRSIIEIVLISVPYVMYSVVIGFFLEILRRLPKRD